MPTADDLAGIGFPGEQAEILGANPQTIAGVGTAQVGAAKILSKNVELTTAGGATAAVLPAAAKINQPHYVVVTTATAGLVFVPLGHSLNGSLNGSLSIAQNKAAILYQYKRNNWTAILSA